LCYLYSMSFHFNYGVSRGIERSREALYLLSLPLILSLLFACTNNDTSKLKKQAAEETDDRISKIEIIEFGKTTTLGIKYEKNAISIEFQPYKGNVESRIELNKDKQIREIISGTQRIQYIYDENGRQIGIFSGNAIQQIMFDYDGENISEQYTIIGNDTAATFRYSYSNGIPNYRKYKLEYSDVKNQLTGFNEMVLPAETSSLLGIPAMYGKNYLKKATRIDAGVLEKEPLKESYTPNFEVIEFDISNSGKQEVLKLVSDGSRQWSATIR